MKPPKYFNFNIKSTDDERQISSSNNNIND